jgi:peptide/nickel transport system permease protein
VITMGFGSLLDHLLRRPIQTPIQATKTGQVAATDASTEGMELKTKGTPKEGLRFYFHFFRRDKPAFAGIIIISLFIAWGFIEGIVQEIGSLTGHASYGWALLPSNPFLLRTTSTFYALQPPSLKDFPYFLFGTNFDGQSLLSRMLYATPHDVEAPIIVVGSAVLIGMFLGTASGYFGGWVDEVIMRVTDAFLSLPALILAIAVGFLFTGTPLNGFPSLLIALMVVWWPTYARFFRAQALTLRERGYVDSAKLSGSGSFRLLIRHIIPNSIDPIIAYMTLDLGSVILFLSSLAFLGIGVSIFYPEWGAESSFGLTFFPQDWWWAIIPGVVIAVIVIAFTLVGDRLQDLISGRMSY